MLILQQRPEAARVARVRAWKDFGRSLRKGEKGIAILVPRFRMEETEQSEEEQRLMGFGLGHVFDVSQTEGEPLPVPPSWRTPGPADPGDIERLSQHIREAGIELRMAQAAVDAGYRGRTVSRSARRIIAVSTDFDPPTRCTRSSTNGRTMPTCGLCRVALSQSP